MTDYPYLMKPEQHRRRAAHLRAQGTPKALEIAYGHEIVAMLIEKQLDIEPSAPSIAPRT